MTNEEIKLRLEKEYPKGVELCYVDYRESINENKSLCLELAETGRLDSLWEDIFDWGEYENMGYILENTFNENEREEIREKSEFRDYFRNWCFEHNISNVEDQLLKNTYRRFYYYDLDLYIEPNFSNDGFWNKPNNNEHEQARKIAKKLGIEYQKYKPELLELVENASYGGDLVILFVADPFDIQEQFRNKAIKFKSGFEVCIMDRCNGSGYSLPIKEEMTFEFKDINLNDDEYASGYSFAHEVCGMLTWDTTSFSFVEEKAKKVRENKRAKRFKDQEKHFEEVFKAGKCSFGDMKQARHRNIEYRNEYPCGDKCLDCGTFWID